MDKDEYDENSDDTEEDDEIGDDTEEDDKIGGDTASKDKEEYDTKEGLNEKQQQNVDNVNGSAVFEKLTSETFLGTGESNLFLQWMNYILMKIQLTMHVGTRNSTSPDPGLLISELSVKQNPNIFRMFLLRSMAMRSSANFTSTRVDLCP